MSHKYEPAAYALRGEGFEADEGAQSSASWGLMMAQGQVSSTWVASATDWAFRIVAQTHAPAGTRQPGRDCSSCQRSIPERLLRGSPLARVCLPDSRIAASSCAP